MAKLHYVKRARKARPKHGIKKGQEYWWWWRRAPGQRTRGTKVFSATKPKPSQILHGYARECAEIEEAVADLAMASPDDAIIEFNSLVDWCRELADDFDEKRANLPDSLQDSETGQKLESRADACRAMADQFEAAANSLDGWTDESIEEIVSDAIDSISFDWGE